MVSEAAEKSADFPRSDDRARELFRDLGELSREQTLAIESDRLQAVALFTRQIEARLSELQGLDSQSLLAQLGADPCLGEQLLRLEQRLAAGRQALRLALRRLGTRRASLARVGVQWYGERPLPTPGRTGLDLRG